MCMGETLVVKTIGIIWICGDSGVVGNGMKDNCYGASSHNRCYLDDAPINGIMVGNNILSKDKIDYYSDEN